MADTSDGGLAETARRAARTLLGTADDYVPLIDWIDDARFALLGEASHGTHEFYRERAQITKRLIVERGFTAVAVEADWPDASRVNRYVRGLSDDVTAVDALGDFKRFPSWMWRNTDVVESSSGCASTMRRSQRASRRPGSTASISTASTRRWQPCSDFWRRSTLPQRAGCVIAMRVSIISATTCVGTGC
jgi:erythromycin esterase